MSTDDTWIQPEPSYSNKFIDPIKKQNTCNNIVATFAIDTSNAPSPAPSKHQKKHITLKEASEHYWSHIGIALQWLWSFLDKALQYIQYFNFKATCKMITI